MTATEASFEEVVQWMESAVMRKFRIHDSERSARNSMTTKVKGWAVRGLGW